MIIKTKEDWITLAKQTVPLLADYMSEFNWSVDPDMVNQELGGLLEKEDWKSLYGRFNEIWSWLPDNRSIRHHPFFDLCDLCSEYWVFEED